jgi:hypothetical protein
MRLTFSTTGDLSEKHGFSPLGERSFGPQRCVKIYGDLYGSATEGRSWARDTSIEVILHASQDTSRLDEALREAIGAFLVVIQDTRTVGSVEIATSPGSAGFYFTIADGKLEIATDERSLFDEFARAENLIDGALANMLVCHQGLGRAPFGSLFSNIHRCLPGGSVVWRGGGDWTTRFFVIPENDETPTQSLSADIVEQFGDVLERSLAVTIDAVGEGRDLALAKSGGIDSSVLLAALCKIGKPFKPFYYPYAAGPQPDLKLASIVCDRLDVPLEIVERSTLDINHARKHGQAGFGTVIAPYKADFGFKDFQPSDRPTLEFNGQNADTLYFVDTFTRSSRHIGWLRFRRDLRSLHNRILLSHRFLNRRPAPKWLQAPPFGVPNEASIGNFVDLVAGTICSTREHTPGFYDASPEGKEDPVIKMVIEHRREHVLKPYLKAFGFADAPADAWPKTGDQAIRLLRMAKWFRFVQNVHANYANFQGHHGRTKFLPYSQGRVSQILLEQRLDLADMFSVKRLLRAYFRSATGFSYSSVVQEMRDGRSEPLSDPDAHARQNRAAERRTEFQQTPPHEIARQLSLLVDAKRMYLCDLASSPVLRDRLRLDYKRLLGETPIEDRSQLMEVTRLVNIDLWLKAALD